MHNRNIRTALSAPLILAMTALALAACSSSASVEGTTPALTDSTDVPSVSLDLSPDAAADREEPLASDLALYAPALDVLQQNSGGSGGLYEVRADQVIPANSDLIQWASGLAFGHERIYEFQSVNEDDPMKTHPANAVLRALVFDSPEAASAALGAYVAKMGRAVSQTEYENGSRWAALLYDVPSNPLPRVSEGLIQRGALIVWALYEDSTSLSWEGTALAVSRLYADALLEQYPSLAS